MKNQKGYTMIEVIVAVMAFGIVFVPITLSLIKGIEMHMTARRHLEMIYEAQEMVEEERQNAHKNPGDPTNMSSSAGSLTVDFDYALKSTGSYGENLPFDEVKDRRYDYDFILTYNGMQLLAGDKTFDLAALLGGRIVLSVEQSGNDKVMHLTPFIGTGDSETIGSPETIVISDHSGNLQLYLVNDNTADMPVALSLEVINAIGDGSDIVFNTEADAAAGILIETGRWSIASGNVYLATNVMPESEAVQEETENKSALYDMNVDVQRSSSGGDYTIHTIHSLQKSDR